MTRPLPPGPSRAPGNPLFPPSPKPTHITHPQHDPQCAPTDDPFSPTSLPLPSPFNLLRPPPPGLGNDQAPVLRGTRKAGFKIIMARAILITVAREVPSPATHTSPLFDISLLDPGAWSCNPLPEDAGSLYACALCAWYARKSIKMKLSFSLIVHERLLSDTFLMRKTVACVKAISILCAF